MIRTIFQYAENFPHHFGYAIMHNNNLCKLIAVGTFSGWFSNEKVTTCFARVSRSDFGRIRESDWLVGQLDNQRLGGNCRWREKTTEEKTIKITNLDHKNIATV